MGDCCKKTLEDLWVMNDEIEEEEIAAQQVESPLEIRLAKGIDSAVFCLYSLVRLCPPNFLKVKRIIKSKEIDIPFDFGTFRNFISERLITVVRQVHTPTHEFKNRINRDKISRYERHGVGLKLEDSEVTTDYFSLKLGHVDIILGLQWLILLKDSTMILGRLSFQIYIGGCKVKLQGDPSIRYSQVQKK